MTKAEIISKISEKTGIEKVTSLAVVEAFMSEVKDSISDNQAVFLRGFGTIGGIILGTIIFGIAKEAFFYIPGIDGSFYRVFLGAVLVAAALTNENIRKRIMGNI